MHNEEKHDSIIADWPPFAVAIPRAILAGVDIPPCRRLYLAVVAVDYCMAWHDMEWNGKSV